MKKEWILKIIVLILMCILFAGPGNAVATQKSDGGIQWFSYAEGRERGEAESKKVFLVFDADWCSYCTKMEKVTFQNPAVIAYVNRNFVPISVNWDKEKKIVAKYNVIRLPSTWFISEKGDRISTLPGYVAPDEMLNILKYIESDSYLSMSFKAFVEKDEK